MMTYFVFVIILTIFYMFKGILDVGMVVGEFDKFVAVYRNLMQKIRHGFIYSWIIHLVDSNDASFIDVSYSRFCDVIF